MSRMIFCTHDTYFFTFHNFCQTYGIAKKYVPCTQCDRGHRLRLSARLWTVHKERKKMAAKTEVAVVKLAGWGGRRATGNWYAGHPEARSLLIPFDTVHWPHFTQPTPTDSFTNFSLAFTACTPPPSANQNAPDPMAP